MNDLADKLIRQAGVVLEDMTPDERVVFLAQLTQGYCPHCGDKREGCQCLNDE